MSTRSRTPPVLEPYLHLPPELSLILLTGTLGCSPNWLTAQFVSSALSPPEGVSRQDEGDSRQIVVFASWMRDPSFWKSELKRTTGVDISKSIQRGQYIILDLLSAQLDSRAGSALASVEKEIIEAIARSTHGVDTKTTLVLDSPDALLATGATSAQDLNSFLLKVRSVVHSVVVTCSADWPLLFAATQSPDSQPTPLETETAAFAVQQAHAARLVMSVRELDTGAAKDVSGVLRITRGGASYDLDNERETETREMEALYLVQRDGNVKVFGRGAEGG